MFPAQPPVQAPQALKSSLTTPGTNRTLFCHEGAAKRLGWQSQDQVRESVFSSPTARTTESCSSLLLGVAGGLILFSASPESFPLQKKQVAFQELQMWVVLPAVFQGVYPQPHNNPCESPSLQPAGKLRHRATETQLDWNPGLQKSESSVPHTCHHSPESSRPPEPPISASVERCASLVLTPSKPCMFCKARDWANLLLEAPWIASAGRRVAEPASGPAALPPSGPLPLGDGGCFWESRQLLFAAPRSLAIRGGGGCEPVWIRHVDKLRAPFQPGTQGTPGAMGRLGRGQGHCAWEDGACHGCGLVFCPCGREGGGSGRGSGAQAGVLILSPDLHSCLSYTSTPSSPCWRPASPCLSPGVRGPGVQFSAYTTIRSGTDESQSDGILYLSLFLFLYIFKIFIY